MNEFGAEEGQALQNTQWYLNGLIVLSLLFFSQSLFVCTFITCIGVKRKIRCRVLIFVFCRLFLSFKLSLVFWLVTSCLSIREPAFMFMLRLFDSSDFALSLQCVFHCISVNLIILVFSSSRLSSFSFSPCMAGFTEFKFSFCLVENETFNLNIQKSLLSCTCFYKNKNCIQYVPNTVAHCW